MPLYEYKCDVCGFSVEQLRPMAELKRIDPCPECAKQNANKTTQFGLLQPKISAMARTARKWSGEGRV